MSFRFLENIATADIAFEIVSPTLENLFSDAADALISVMIKDLNSIKDSQQIPFEQSNLSIEMLLFNVLQELIFFKDSQLMLYRFKDVSITQVNQLSTFHATLYGEQININRHKILVDVKAVTLHNFFVKKENNNWKSQIILDI